VTVRCGVNSKNYDAYALTQTSKYSKAKTPKDPTLSGPDVLFDSPPSIAENLFHLAILLLALLCLAAPRAKACGPNFPNNLLGLGDDAVLKSPVTSFERELKRMKILPSRFHAAPPAYAQSHLSQTLDAEMNDLETALRRAKVPAVECERIRAAHQVAREKLKAYVEEFERWATRDPGELSNELKPRFPQFENTPGLPAEFVDCFDGAVAWHNPTLADRSMAREPWERLLARPEAERKFKSLWAAYMLGKSWEGKDRQRAAGYFRRVRELAAQGFADSSGLAAASLGLEARLHYRGADYVTAIALYLEQLATGDPTAANSLLEVAAMALAEAKPDTLRDLATNTLARQVLTAYLISRPESVGSNEDGETHPVNRTTIRWLRAVGAAGVTNVESAERFALAAYQGAAFDLAQRWINHCTNSPAAQWVQAKLLSRAGKIESAAALLAKVVKRLSVVGSGADSQSRSEFAENLFMRFNEEGTEAIPARRQMLGELGVLHLCRGEFILALDALLRAGYWGDAAYVAERVLTVEELKDYVDRNWPLAASRSLAKDAARRSMQEPQAVSANTEEEMQTETAMSSKLGQKIRYLLARRLTREIHGDIAREYYPAEWQSHFDALASALLTGWDVNQPEEQRATALFHAAGIARTNGMELLGTEVQPDWHIWGGNFEEGVKWQNRAANEHHAKINVATAGETGRAADHCADPEERFHYRYQAAFLGWEAARLMPNHSDATAKVLWTSGYWLKNRDPDTADIFYKALVRRCRRTALGAEADRIRWFPRLDENGNLPSPESREELPSPIATEAFTPIEQVEAAAATSEEPSLSYILQDGDSLAMLLKAVRELNLELTLEDILNANPGLDPANLKNGQRILIPSSSMTGDGESSQIEE